VNGKKEEIGEFSNIIIINVILLIVNLVKLREQRGDIVYYIQILKVNRK